MKQDYGMFFFCLLACFSSARPPLHQTMPLELFLHYSFNPNSQSNCSCLVSDHMLPSPKSKLCRRFVYMDICITTYEAVLSHFLYQFQLICLFFFRLDRLQHHNMK